jgi:hypothetical protein
MCCEATNPLLHNASVLFFLQHCFHNPITGKTMLTWDEEVKPSSQKPTDGWSATTPRATGSAVIRCPLQTTCTAASNTLSAPIPNPEHRATHRE